MAGSELEPGAESHQPRAESHQPRAESHQPSAESHPARSNESLQGPSLIPAGGRFEGLVVFRERARIDGHHQGPVRGTGALEIGEHGRVDGDIASDALRVGGTVHGAIRVREQLRVEGTAQVEGSVRAPILEVADGGRIEGECLTGAAARQPC